MISVENFYFVLYENLLKSNNFLEFIFYPFGTTNRFQIGLLAQESKNNVPTSYYSTSIRRRVFFYDQEPLLIKPAKQVLDTQPYSTKTPSILANSEISVVKQQLVKDYGFLDWYYFYHGFVALDWFRDAVHLKNVNYPIRNSFLSLNGIVTGDRNYRMSLVARLAEKNLVNKGSVSFHANNNDCSDELNNKSLSEQSKNLIKKHLTLMNNGFYVDTDQHNPNNSASFGHFELKMFQHSLFHVVSETVFYHNKLHLTEKIFKPIVSRRPFILVAAPGNLAYLKRYGFKTFDKWIDENYDNVHDHDQRLDMIVKEIEKISQLSVHELNSLHQEMKEVLDYNFNHLFTNFKSIIVNELVDNFQSCLLQWNNGRVDDRKLNTDLNWSEIKTILKS